MRASDTTARLGGDEFAVLLHDSPMEAATSVAEESGLILEVGQWALETAAAQVAAWRRTYPDLTLNVSVSGHQLVHPRFADDVMRALRWPVCRPARSRWSSPSRC